EDGIRDKLVTGVQTCALPISLDPAQFDAVVLVDAGVALRRTRLRAMRGLSNDEADRMIAAQMPAERKRAKSDVVIENEGSLEQRSEERRVGKEGRCGGSRDE